MQKDLFLTAITNNQEGASIDPDTMQPINTNKGYFVSITDNERVRADYRIVGKLKKEAKRLNLTKYFIGYWRDSKTGKHFFDLSLLVENKDVAVSMGKMFNQKAIFSNLDKQVLYI